MKRNAASRTRRKSVLERLLGEMPKTRFLERVWAQTSCVVHAAPRRVREVSSLAIFDDADALLSHVERAGEPSVRVKAWFQDRDGKQTGVTVDAAAAKKLYRAGNVTIVVDDLHVIVPSVRAMLEAIQAETGTPGELSCNAYLSPPGAGTRMHFDPQETFLLQLRGKKRWQYAPNAQVSFAGSSLSALGPEALSQLHASFPTTMPTTARTTVLKPGSVLYMTRGTWHESRTIEHSVAITLTFTSQTWGDLLLEVLRARMVAQEKWRRPAVGVTASGPLAERAERTLDALLDALVDEARAMGGS